MNLKGKRIAILAENLYQEMELWVPYYRMKEEGAEVKVVGAGGARSYTSKHGYPVTVDVQADAVTAVEFDAVVVPGGYAPDMMRRHDAMVKLVRGRCPAGQGGRGHLPRRVECWPARGSSRARRSPPSSPSRTTW
jgi:protease I